MDFIMKYQIVSSLLPVSKRRAGIAMPEVKFLVAHDTGNPGSTAAENIAYYRNSCNEDFAAAHLFVDHREILECVPALIGTPEKACHVLKCVSGDDELFGCNANDAAIGVEYCYGGNIDADEAYRKYVWVLAYACHRYGLQPWKHIVAHCFLDPARRRDPVNGLACSRRSFEQLLIDIRRELEVCTGQILTPVRPTSQSGIVKTTVRLNIRKGEPRRMAPVLQVVPAGVQLPFVGTCHGEVISGNPLWYEDGKGNFFWSGGVI